MFGVTPSLGTSAGRTLVAVKLSRRVVPRRVDDEGSLPSSRLVNARRAAGRDVYRMARGQRVGASHFYPMGHFYPTGYSAEQDLHIT